MKQCRKCGDRKPETDFYKFPRNRDGLMHLCKRCHSVYRKLGRYNLSQDQMSTLMADLRCAICKVDVQDEFVIDHDHRCCPKSAQSCGRCVRGVLCHRCNRVLGSMNDDPELLRAAIEYLLQWG